MRGRGARLGLALAIRFAFADTCVTCEGREKFIFNRGVLACVMRLGLVATASNDAILDIDVLIGTAHP